MASARFAVERTCLGCRRVKPQTELVRYVLSPDGQLLVDLRQRLAGRGAYTCCDPVCIAAAVRRGQFSRAFRRPVSGLEATTLIAALAEQLREQVLSLVGLARKAGQVVSGSNLVLAALGGQQPPAVVLVAGDASAGIAAKVSGKAGAVGTRCWRCFDKRGFGQLLGREERSVVAVKAHPLADKLHNELIRYTHIVGEN